MPHSLQNYWSSSIIHSAQRVRLCICGCICRVDFFWSRTAGSNSSFNKYCQIFFRRDVPFFPDTRNVGQCLGLYNATERWMIKFWFFCQSDRWGKMSWYCFDLYFQACFGRTLSLLFCCHGDHLNSICYFFKAMLSQTWSLLGQFKERKKVNFSLPLWTSSQLLKYGQTNIFFKKAYL